MNVSDEINDVSEMKREDIKYRCQSNLKALSSYNCLILSIQGLLGGSKLVALSLLLLD